MFLLSFSLTRKVQTMFNLKSFFAFVSLFSLLFTACNNKDEIVSPVQQKQLSKIVQDANNYSVFNYTDGKLSKYENYSNSQLSTAITLNYDGTTKPKSENYISFNQDYIKYYYYDINSLLDSMTFSTKDNSGSYILSGYVKYFYDGNKQLTKTEQFTTSNSFVVRFEYSYDSNGNVIEEKQYRSSGLYSDATMTYDNKVNPWYNLSDCLFYPVSMSKNNLLSKNQVFSDSTQENYQNTITYVYDSDGYPISSITQLSSQSNNLTINNTFEYK